MEFRNDDQNIQIINALRSFLKLKQIILILLLSSALLPVYAQTGLFTDEKSTIEPVVETSVSVSKNRLAPGEEAEITVSFVFPEGFHQTRTEDFFSFEFTDSSGFPIGTIQYPEGIIEEGLVNYYGRTDLKAVFSVSESIPAGPAAAQVKASWQICDEAGTCYFPEERTMDIQMEVLAKEGVSAGALSSFVKFLFLALLGGLLLNVMPCVLPILSMRALNLVRQSANDKKSILIGSLLYGAGVLVSLLILAGVVIGLKATGQLAGWGFQFQNPVFVMVLITVIFIFALSLFDVFIINAPGMNRMVAAANKKGWLGSFFNGVFAVLLATPCTAPFLGTALGFAFSQPPLFIIASFSAIGIGFALPFLLIGIWPGLVQSLPKPGKWMDTFKELMGFLLFGTAIYLFSSLRFQINQDSQFRFIIFLTVAAFFVWLYGKLSRPDSRFPSPVLALVLTIAAISVSAAMLIKTEQPDSETGSALIHEGWEEFSPETVEQYRNEGKGVFLAFGASWCSVCKLNETRVLYTDEADSFFTERGVIRIKGDYTNKDPVIDEWIRKFGKGGVPVYVYYPADGSDYIIFPEILSFDILTGNIPPLSMQKTLDDSMFIIQPE